MADITNIKWLYPPNFLGTYESHLKSGHKRHVIQCTNYSDGTGEDDAIKVKRKDMLTTSGNIPSKLVVEKVWYQIAGLTVTIAYNNENEDEICRLYSGEGEIDFTKFGGFVPADESTSGDTFESGDIVFTTTNESSGDSYNIILTVRLKD